MSCWHGLKRVSTPHSQDRGIAQPGSAAVLGTAGRWFESSCPDQQTAEFPGGPRRLRPLEYRRRNPTAVNRRLRDSSYLNSRSRAFPAPVPSSLASRVPSLSGLAAANRCWTTARYSSLVSVLS